MVCKELVKEAASASVGKMEPQMVYSALQLNDLLDVDRPEVEVMKRARSSEEEVGIGGGKERRQKDDCLPLRLPVRRARAKQWSRQRLRGSSKYGKKEAAWQERCK